MKKMFSVIMLSIISFIHADQKTAADILNELMQHSRDIQDLREKVNNLQKNVYTHEERDRLCEERNKLAYRGALIAALNTAAVNVIVPNRLYAGFLGFGSAATINYALNPVNPKSVDMATQITSGAAASFWATMVFVALDRIAARFVKQPQAQAPQPPFNYAHGHNNDRL